MKRIAVMVVAVGVMGLGSRQAAGQVQQDLGDTYRPVNELALQVGGGVTQFVSESARQYTGVGGGWDVRMGIATRRWLGFEAAYVGSWQDVARPAPGTTSLLSNGAELLVRLGLPIVRGSWLIAPMAVAGVGWTYYALTSESIVAPFATSEDNMVTVPVGAGVALGYRGLLADVRFMFRPTFNDDLFEEDIDMSTWRIGAHLGVEF